MEKKEIAVINANHTRKMSSKFRAVIQHCYTNVNAKGHNRSSLAQSSQPLGFEEGARNLGVSKLGCISPTLENKWEASFYFELTFISHELIFK